MKKMASEKSVLVIWNHFDTPKYLSSDKTNELCKRLNFMVQAWQPFSAKTTTLITNPGDLDMREVRSLEKGYDAIFVLAELTWHNRLRSKFYGFDIVRDLRLAGVLVPIFVFSFCEESLLLTNNPLAKILQAPGHFLVHLKAEGGGELQAKMLNDFAGISVRTLEDIKHEIFSIEGQASRYLHDFKSDLFQVVDPADAIEKFIANVRQLVFAENNLELEEIGNDMAVDSELFENLDQYRNQLWHLLKIETPEASPPNKEEIKRTWGVLYLDDETHFLDRFEDELLAHDILCLRASNAEEAWKLLDKDIKEGLEKEDFSLRVQPQIERVKFSPGFLTVLICDWRLKDTSNNWHQHQGYSVIERCYRKINPLAYFVVTTKKISLLRNLQSNQDIEVLYFSKEDIIRPKTEGPNWREFLNTLISRGEFIRENSDMQPQVGPWKKKASRHRIPLGEVYNFYLNSSQYWDLKQTINSEADYHLKNLDIDRLDDKLLKPKNASSICVTSQVYLPLETTEDLKETLKELRNFMDRLIARRVLLVAHALEFDPFSALGQIANLNNGEASPTYLPNFLCLSSNIEVDIPGHILPEELEFLLGRVPRNVLRYRYQHVKNWPE